MNRVLWSAGAILALVFPFASVHAQRTVVGETIHQSFETPHPYAGTASVSPQRAWSDTLHFPGAAYISPHFSRFHLAEGDYVIVRSPDGLQSWRYEGLGRAGLGLDPEGFWSSRIKGDTAIVELFSMQAEGEHGYTIDLYARGYTIEEMGGVPPNSPEAICGADDSQWARCYADSEPEIYEQSRAVVRLHIAGVFLCTGWLVGCEGHLMTNNHCIGSVADALNTDYEFMAEGATCETSCFGSSACAGPVEATSGTLVQTHGALDYSLILLPTNVSETYGYMQLRDTGAVLDERIYIPQHPQGWGKRIAVASDHPTDASGFCEVFSLSSPPCSGGPGDIGYYCDTQSGSSGSPVLGYDDHRVVSLHHCANCPNRGLDILDVIASLGDNLPECAVERLEGTIELDRESYSCSDELTITVNDDSIRGAGSTPVTATSTSEPAPETITLAEVSLGKFVGAVPSTDGPASTGDGLLSLSHDDPISVIYIDADDGAGGTDIPREATARADCAAPQIFNVLVSHVTRNYASIQWETDEPSEGFVQYGTEPPGSESVADEEFGTLHEVVLEGLDDCVEHFFSVTALDVLENAATDDNNGDFYTFTTECGAPPPVPDGSGPTLPVLVERSTLDGSEIVVHHDGTCGFEANLIYGPLEEVSDYTVAGGLCAVSEAHVWDSVPAGNLWFLLVGDNGTGLESAWGPGESGERNGLQSSGQCGNLFKNSSGTCP